MNRDNHFAPGTHTIVVDGAEVTYYVAQDVHDDLDSVRRDENSSPPATRPVFRAKRCEESKPR